MLSRSAERIYWLARYLERTENTARLVSIYMNFLMDMPRDVQMGWVTLVHIIGGRDAFNKLYKSDTERNVCLFLLTDLNNSASLLSSLSFARENIRTSRELLPDEAWELVNEMYLFAKSGQDNILNRRERYLFLQHIIQQCQRFTGLLSGAMCKDNPYGFIRLGRSLERADMTTRILDIGTLLLAEDRSNQIRQYESIIWMNILKSVSALLMYRQQVRSRIKGHDVLTYLLKDTSLPRSVGCCIKEMVTCINELPNHNNLPEYLQVLEQYLNQIKINESSQLQIHEILDVIQKHLGEINNQICQHWFLVNGQPLASSAQQENS